MFSADKLHLQIRKGCIEKWNRMLQITPNAGGSDVSSVQWKKLASHFLKSQECMQLVFSAKEVAKQNFILK